MRSLNPHLSSPGRAGGSSSGSSSRKGPCAKQHALHPPNLVPDLLDLVLILLPVTATIAAGSRPETGIPVDAERAEVIRDRVADLVEVGAQKVNKRAYLLRAVALGIEAV